MTVLMFLLLALLTICAAVLLANRWRRPEFGLLPAEGNQDALPTASTTLSALTWNIGYGGLGNGADFFVDKGKSLRALSRQEIRQAASEIADTLKEAKADIICMQESASAGFLTRGVPVRDIINRALPNMRRFYWADLKTILLPAPLRFDHGMATYSALEETSSEIIGLTQSDDYYFGFLKKYYVGQCTRLPIAGSERMWVVINIHLSAFDAGGRVRTAQLREALAFGQREFAKGHHVVFGGDWNMRLCPATFPHTTEEAYLSWLVDFPTEALADGWQIILDPDTPTMRSLQKPYIPGENFTAVVDGFIVSPNVAAADVETIDLGFGPTDHQPVTAKFTALRY